MDNIRFRQIHLDFHTSEAIPGIGKEWSKAHFQDMLKLGHVNAINIFAKCHHGWSYFPTKTPLANQHPGLNFDLLGKMIEACHEIDVKCPVYISAGLDEQIVRSHAGWLRLSGTGQTGWVGWMQPGYHVLCFRSPYLDHLTEYTEEVVKNYDLDGVWLDIVGVGDCACQYCIAELRKRGEDPRDDAARLVLARETYLMYANRLNNAVRAIKPGMPVFHNSGHITRGDRELAGVQDHFELESLPTGGWGYDHFPLSARYVQGLQGKEFLGMTGKFHTTWGEFGGYKHPNALRYEAALNLANGGKVCVGDQMHPYGQLDQATYRLVGEAYAEVEAKEAWCGNVTCVADVGVITVEAMTRDVPGFHNTADEGAVRILQQAKVLYDIIDPERSFDSYKLIILPDVIPVTGALKAKLTAYLAAGGKVLATGTSALDAATGEFALDFGIRSKGETAFKPEYVAPRFKLNAWDPAAFVIYSPMQDIELKGATTLADRQDPFFNRDYLHFNSHQHFPSTQINAGPAIVRTANTCYIAFPAFGQYVEMGQVALKDIVAHCLGEMLPEPTLTTTLPVQGVQNVMRQSSEGRTVIHLLYAVPVKRSANIEVIEELVPLHNIDIALRTADAPKRVTLAPQGSELAFTYEGGVVRATVPTVECHQMVIVE